MERQDTVILLEAELMDDFTSDPLFTIHRLSWDWIINTGKWRFSNSNSISLWSRGNCYLTFSRSDETESFWQRTSNIPFPWFLMLGCNSQAQDHQALNYFLSDDHSRLMIPSFLLYVSLVLSCNGYLLQTRAQRPAAASNSLSALMASGCGSLVFIFHSHSLDLFFLSFPRYLIFFNTWISFHLFFLYLLIIKNHFLFHGLYLLLLERISLCLAIYLYCIFLLSLPFQFMVFTKLIFPNKLPEFVFLLFCSFLLMVHRLFVFHFISKSLLPFVYFFLLGLHLWTSSPLWI